MRMMGMVVIERMMTGGFVVDEWMIGDESVMLGDGGHGGRVVQGRARPYGRK